MLDASGDLFSNQEKGAVLAEMYRTGYIGAYIRESNMSAAYSGQPGKLGDIPLIVLSQKMDAQKLRGQYPPDFQSQLTLERWQEEADNVSALQDELAALSTHGRRIIVEASGHFIQLDQPQVVIDAIREVFEQVANEGDILD
jgi:pimeloyl-ACP methyl ester carboxylesterase